jgi:hypothetical protein
MSLHFLNAIQLPPPPDLNTFLLSALNQEMVKRRPTDSEHSLAISSSESGGHVIDYSECGWGICDKGEETQTIGGYTDRG